MCVRASVPAARAVIVASGQLRWTAGAGACGRACRRSRRCDIDVRDVLSGGDRLARQHRRWLDHCDAAVRECVTAVVRIEACPRGLPARGDSGIIRARVGRQRDVVGPMRADERERVAGLRGGVSHDLGELALLHREAAGELVGVVVVVMVRCVGVVAVPVAVGRRVVVVGVDERSLALVGMRRQPTVEADVQVGHHLDAEQPQPCRHACEHAAQRQGVDRAWHPTCGSHAARPGGPASGGEVPRVREPPPSGSVIPPPGRGVPRARPDARVEQRRRTEAARRRDGRCARAIAAGARALATVIGLGLTMTARLASASPFAVVHPVEPPVEDGSDGSARVVKVRTRSDGLTASGRRIGSDQIQTAPKRSAEDLLRMVPGLLIVQHGNQGKGYQFYVRGFDAVHGSDIEFELGDVPINEPSNVHAHGYLDLAWIIPETVKQIDAHKGAFRLEQGNFATAASIRYELAVPEKLRGTRMSYEVGTTNRHRVAFVHAPRGRAQETFLAGEVMTDAGYGANRKADRLSAMAQLRLWQRDGFAVDALATAYQGRFGLPGTVRLDDVKTGRENFYGSYVTGQGGVSQRSIASLRLSGAKDDHRVSLTLWGQARRLRLDENYTGWLVDPVHGDRHAQHQDNAAIGVALDYERQLSDRAALRVVGSWRGDAIDQRQDELLANGHPWSSSRDLGILQQSFGIAPGLRLTPRRGWLLDGGLRFDAFDAHVHDRLAPAGTPRASGTLVQLSPRLATRVTILPRWQAFAAYGRGFRTPEARAFTLPTTAPENVDLSAYAGGKPRMTTTENVELGSRVQPSELFDVGASAFGIWIARESIFDHVSGFNVELNSTRRLGLEADVQIHPTRWLDLGIDLTAVQARFVDSKAPIPGAPPLFVQIQGALNHPKGFRAGLRWFVLGPRPLTHGAKAGATTVMDVSVGYRIKWMQLDVSIDNVYATKWREGEYNFASWWDRSQRASQVPAIQFVAGPPTMARFAATVYW